jgi:hypothetical protein
MILNTYLTDTNNNIITSHNSQASDISGLRKSPENRYINRTKKKNMKIKYALLFLFAATLIVGCGTTGSTTNSGSSGGGGQTIKGTITGKQYSDHKVYFQNNQLLTMSMDASNTSCYFNILTPEGEAVHNGSRDGNNFKGTMGFNGYYTVRVYLMGAANSDNQKVNYTIRYSVK